MCLSYLSHLLQFHWNIFFLYHLFSSQPVRLFDFLSSWCNIDEIVYCFNQSFNPLLTLIKNSKPLTNVHSIWLYTHHYRKIVHLYFCDQKSLKSPNWEAPNWEMRSTFLTPIFIAIQFKLHYSQTAYSTAFFPPANVYISQFVKENKITLAKFHQFSWYPTTRFNCIHLYF